MMRRSWRPEWTPWLVAACTSGLVATWLAGSERFHVYDSDSLVPKLTSTMEWSFYYWHTARNGQLLSLLAMPFTHPLTNLVAQQWLGTFAGVMAIYLLVAFVMRGRPWFASGTAAVASFLVGATSYGHNLYLEGSHTFGTSMALVLGGLLVARDARPRRADAVRIASAAALVATGIWVNLMVVLLAGAVVAVDGLLNEDEPSFRIDVPSVPPLARRWMAHVAIGLGLLVGCLATVMVVTRLFAPSGMADRMTLSPVAWTTYPNMVATLASNTIEKVVAPGGAILVAAAVIGAAWLDGRNAWPRSVTILAAAGFGFFMVAAGMKWVAMNKCEPRYVLPAIIAGYACVGVLLAATVGEALHDVADESRPLEITRWTFTAAVPVALLLGYGLPDTGAARRAIAPIGSPLAEQVVESGVEFVAGDYWSLWPAVFKANLILYDLGETRRVWGLGFRASNTRHRWEATVRDGGATVVHIARTPQPCRHDLQWIGEHLDLEIGDRESSLGDLDLYRFRLRDGRIARR